MQVTKEKRLYMETKNRKPLVVIRVEFSPSNDAGHRLGRVFELLLAKHSDNHLNGKQQDNKTTDAVNREETWQQ